MGRLAMGSCRVAVAVALLLGAALGGAAAGRQPARVASHDIPIPGGTAELLRAGGVATPVEAPRALLVLVRNLHGPFTPLGERRLLEAARATLARALREGRPAERVPGLLPAAVWEQAVFRKKVAAGELAGAILADRQAAFLYWGLFSLDDETLAFLASQPGLVAELYGRSAAAFAAYAEGIHVSGNLVQVPGGAPAAEAWQAALGVPPGDPVRFLARLFERADGRVAQLFGALGRLDPPHLAFALGARAGDLPALIASASRFDPEVQLPFVAWAEVDVPFLLEVVAVTPDGRLAPPGGRWFWNAAFHGEVAAGPRSPEELSPAQLVDLLAGGGRVERRARLDALLFAQRRFAAEFATGAHGVGDETRWLEPAADFGTVPTLLLTLEQVGFVEPVDYRAAGAAAAALAQVGDTAAASRRIAVLQSAVALVARCERVGSIDGPAARALISDLFRAASLAPEHYALAVLARVRQLLERLPGGAAGGSAEDRLLDGLAGVGVAGAKPVIEWEGRRYEVDAARAERKRLGTICEMQGGRTLDAVIALGTSVGELLDPSATPERVGAAAAAVAAAAGGREAGEEWLFGFRLDGVRNGLVEAAQDALRKPGQARSDGTRRRLAAGLEADLAAVLVSHVYALWLDPESPLVSGDSPGRRHDFGLGGLGSGPWAFARQADLGSTRGVRGSLLGLDRCLAREVLRPTRLGLPGRAPTLRPEDARGLAESIVALNPFRLTAGAGLVAGAVKRGRARVTAAARDVAALDTLLASAGVDGIRRRLARGAAATGPEAVLDQLSLAELLALGEDFRAPVPGAVLAHWGTAARLVDGSLGQRMPRRLAWLERAWRPGAGLLPTQVADLQIRTAEWLADRRLPSALAHGILSLAAWDLALTVQVSSPDDWLPVVRAAQAVPPERFEDYVSALAATGVLVPLPPRK